MRLDVYFHFSDMSEVLARLDSMAASITGLTLGVKTMSQQLEVLTQEVAEIGTVVDSAVALINGLSAQIVALKDDPVALAALAATLDAKAGELGAAVAANTPPTP